LIWSSDIPANLPTVNIDPERMGQAIGNLLSNGIKYTPVEGSVSLSARQEGAEILIIVTDSGPGIVLEEHEKIFEPFFRSSHDRRFPQGLGLGLTIARDMVEAHDGQLVVSSEEGRGSQFVIHLPSNGDMLAKS
jgi:signal transduction histidine kinase